MLAIVNSRSLSCEADGQRQFNTIRLRYASMSVGIIAPADAKHNVIRDLKPGSPADDRNDAIDPKPTSDLHQIFAVAITGLRTSVRQNVTLSFGTGDGTDSFHFY
jgi:hypothetical protein